MSIAELPSPTEEGEVEDAYRSAVIRMASQIRLQREAQRLVVDEEAAKDWRPPWEGQSGLLSELLKAERTTDQWLVERLMGWGHNVVLAAQHGSGKTTLGLNLARALVDGKPFLDREVTPFEGRIGWINGEMDTWDWRDYAKPMRIRHPERIESMHLRDARLPLINDLVAEQFTDWCIARDIRVLVFDSWRRLCAWSGLDENVNADVERLTARLDEVKKAAGVHACLLLAHTGRAKAEEGEERVRGATALDDWADARWVMVKKDDQRYMFADKRGVEMAETALKFDPLTYRISLGEGNRRTAVNQEWRDAVVLMLGMKDAAGGLSQSAMEKEMRIRGGALKPVLTALERDGEVHSIPGKTRGLLWLLNNE